MTTSVGYELDLLVILPMGLMTRDETNRSTEIATSSTKGLRVKQHKVTCGKVQGWGGRVEGAGMGWVVAGVQTSARVTPFPRA